MDSQRWLFLNSQRWRCWFDLGVADVIHDLIQFHGCRDDARVREFGDVVDLLDHAELRCLEAQNQTCLEVSDGAPAHGIKLTQQGAAVRSVPRIAWSYFGSWDLLLLYFALARPTHCRVDADLHAVAAALARFGDAASTR